MMPLDMLANLCNDGMTPLTDNSESMMATILDCNILNSMVIIGKETMKPETTRDKGIVAAIQYFAFNLTDGAPSAASKVGSQIDDGCDASAETLVDEALRCSNATYSPGEVSGRPSEAEVLASDAPTVVPTHEVSIATSEPPCTASSAFEAHGEPAENGLLGIATEESKSRCPEVGEMASHNIADRFNMNDRFASIDDDDDIVSKDDIEAFSVPSFYISSTQFLHYHINQSFCRDQLQPARETQQGCENHEEYELEDDGNGRDNSEDTNLDVGAEEEGPMETIDEDSDEMYDLGSLPLNLNAAAGHSAVTDFASPIDYNTPSATDAVLDAFLIMCSGG
ncbi:hypothetical protein BC829DRAFT_233780 [Chytridium lagenaria]|nr:hypothetical protein BC829DRAFT_233780 [Chytridium lagenaria]